MVMSTTSTIGEDAVAPLIDVPDSTYWASWLSAEYKTELFKLAKAREDGKWSTRRVMNKYDDMDLQGMGIVGEGAFEVATTACGVRSELDRRIFESGGDKGIDFVLPNSWTVAVKFTHRLDFDLLVEKRDGDALDDLQDLKADVLVLTSGFCCRENCDCKTNMLNGSVGSHVLIRGWVTYNEFIMNKRTKDYRSNGGGDRWCMTQAELRPFDSLIHYCTMDIEPSLINSKPTQRPGRVV